MAQNKIVISPDTTTVTVSSVGLNGPAGPSGSSDSDFPYTGSAIISGSLEVTGSIYSNSTIFATASNAISSSYALTASYVGNAESSDSATNANNVYIDTGDTNTIFRIPTALATTDGYYQLKSPLSNLIYYHRTTNPITGTANGSDYLYVGGGANTAGGIFLNSTVTVNPFITSDQGRFYIYAGGGDSGILHLSASNYIDIVSDTTITGSLTLNGSNYLVPGTVNADAGDTVVLTGSAYDSTPMIKVTHQRSSNGDITMTLPDATLSNSTNRTIRFISDSTVDNQHRALISPSGSQTLDGGGAFTMDRSYEGIMVWSDGTEWYKIQAKNV
jgi:hypothetical protein